MTEYGVNVTNKFAFLDEDVLDPEEDLIKSKEAKKEKTVISPVVKKTTIVEPPKVIKSESSNQNQEYGKQRNDTGGGGRSPIGGNQRNSRNNLNSNSGGWSNRFDENDKNDGAQKDGERKPYDRKDRPQFQDKKDRPPQRRFRNGDENAPPRTDGDRSQRGENERGFRGDRVQRNDGDREQRGPRTAGDRNFGGTGTRGTHPPPRAPRFQKEKETNKEEAPKTESGGKEVNEWAEKPSEWSENASEWAEKAEVESKDVDTTDKPAVENVDQSDQAATQEEPEPEMRVRTLEEWKAEYKYDEPQFNSRKPGEGGDAKVYRNLVPIKKDAAPKEQVSEDEHHVHKEKREKALSIEVQFVDPKRNYNNEGADRFVREKMNRGPPGGNSGPRGPPRGDSNRQSGGGNFRSGGAVGNSGDSNRQSGGGNFRSGGAGGNPNRPPRDSGGGNNYDSGVGNRSYDSGGGNRSYNSGAGSSGANRRQPTFNLESEQFPALGAAH